MGDNRVNFNYDKNYFENHYKSSFYRWYITSIRNRTIINIAYKWLRQGRILEIGFGDDNLLKQFNERFEIFGIDISDFAVSVMKNKYNPENFRVCNVDRERIPFPYKFDAVFAINVIEHLQHPEYALENIYSSLKEGGLFLVHMPLRSNMLSRFQYKFLYDVPEHLYRPSFDSLNMLLNKIGFELLEKFVPSFFPVKIGLSWVINSFNLFLGVYRKQF